MKYRCVEVISNGIIKYEIQYKSLFLWWTIDDLQVCNDGVAWNESLSFETKQKAIDYIDRVSQNKRTVIYETEK